MEKSKKISDLQMAAIIESRSPVGRHDMLQGWHNLLKKILDKMVPYLTEGQLVTFRNLSDRERVFFENLQQIITIPADVTAIYLPPSVRFQMLYHRPDGETRAVPDHSMDDPPDEGVVLACRKTDFSVVINALMAKPPFAPAIDVYEDGQLLAGYVYHTIEECISRLAAVMKIHLHSGHRQE
jgi:hypothetical protein